MMNEQRTPDNNPAPISQPPAAASAGRFLAGVGALLRDGDRYLLLRRAATKDFAAGAWECVTGRVDQGEGFAAAVRREVAEELGVAVTPEYLLATTHFYRGTAVPENELVGVVYLCSWAGEQPITLSAEHDAFRWVTAVEAAQLLTATDPSTAWTRQLIARAEEIRPLLTDDLRHFNRRNGLEIG